ncbi:MAG: accessory factor UbiK family protein [Gammaproteobacteria bacterium]|nr:MAG: accessory factor UbiK family protein [Gammaproteobacteria bacterium]
MAADDPIRNLTDQIRDLLPRGGPSLPPGFQDNIRAIVQGMLARSELVTRDEFEAQRAVLQRTREKLETLERSVARLEAGSERSVD